MNDSNPSQDSAYSNPPPHPVVPPDYGVFDYPDAPTGRTRIHLLVLMASVISVLTAVVLLGTLARHLGSHQSDKGLSEGTPITTSLRSSANGPVVGDAVSDGEVTFVVNTIEAGTLNLHGVNGEEAYTEGQFIVVSISVSNNGPSTLKLPLYPQYMIDTQGITFTPSPVTLSLAGDMDQIVVVPSGDNATVRLVFDVPIKVVPKTLVLHAGFHTEGVHVMVVP